MLVYSAHVSWHDHPQYVANDAEGLAAIQGQYVGLEQCDDCGNHSFRVDGLHAVCERDPGEAEEFAHSAPCGRRWPITLRHEDDVAF